MSIKIPSLKETVVRMQMEIIEDAATGRIPADSLSFDQLHDHVDANEYGGLCDDELFDTMIEHFGGRDSDDGLPSGFNNRLNDAQNSVNFWMKEGGISVGPPPVGWNFFDRERTDYLNPHGFKPYNSVFDKIMGGNMAKGAGYPMYHLTIVREGSLFGFAHGGVVKEDRFDSTKAAANGAIDWYVEHGLEVGQSLEDSYPAVDVEIAEVKSQRLLSPAEIIKQSQVVKTGIFSGQVLKIEGSIVTQKINREGDIVTHDAWRLSSEVAVGQMFDVRYKDGKGAVSGVGKATEIGR
jgi:hypothetical protein